MQSRGFTIVELLIVIVVIGILAAISIVAYSGIQDRSRQSKIDSDMRNLKQAILAARNAQGDVALRYVTLSTASGANCWGKASGTDLAALTRADGCWTAYLSSLGRISTASGINVNNLVDPWGRPYYMDENEGEGADPPNACGDDYIGFYAQPFTTGQTMTKHTTIPNIQPACL